MRHYAGPSREMSFRPSILICTTGDGSNVGAHIGGVTGMKPFLRSEPMISVGLVMAKKQMKDTHDQSRGVMIAAVGLVSTASGTSTATSLKQQITKFRVMIHHGNTSVEDS